LFSALYTGCRPYLVRSLSWHANCILSLTSLVIKTTDIKTTKAVAHQLAISAGWAFSSPYLKGGFMNRLHSAFFGLGLLLAASAVQAQDNGVKADIPFDFVVGNQMLPAGEYTVVNQGPVNQAILIRSDEGKTAILSLTQPCSSHNPSAKTKLVFHTMAGRYFLYQIWTQGNSSGRQLPKSKAEVELAKNTDTTGEFVLAASLTR
jgi:hypothetical protein